VYWAIAFIAGFSDKFYERLIELLVGTLGDPRKSEGADENDTLTRSEAIASSASLTREQQVLIALHWRELGGKESLRGYDLREANLRMAALDGADLHQAKLTGADLHGTSLSGTDLSEADLQGADLIGADLREANLQGAKLLQAQVTKDQLAQAASLEGATMPDGTIYAGEPPTRRASELTPAPERGTPDDE
jgi:uncharacterized protein YjbI with pentapeptide repeats